MLKAARELIEQQGPAAATMAAVAERAGVSRRAVYLHFASRSDLLAALFDYLNEVEDRDAAFRPLWEAADGIAALDARAQIAADFLPRIMPTARALQQATRHDPDAPGTGSWPPRPATTDVGEPSNCWRTKAGWPRSGRSGRERTCSSRSARST
ncbi:hypothetical protein BJF79_04785 [Actinomadura sp. CNU-125]|nr:hypothetical protein BJF79_04785 [Actinomadura sp. CNU-125]